MVLTVDGGAPDWIPEAGTFADISLNTASDVNPCPADNCTYSRLEGQNGGFVTWTSGIYAPELGSLGSYLCWGGGHAAHDGTYVNRYDLSTRLWSILGTPSNYSQASNPADSTGAFPDGKPVPPHNYVTLGIRTSAGGGGTYGSLIQATQPAAKDNGDGIFSSWWAFDLEDETWSRWQNWTGRPVGTLTYAYMVQEPGGNMWYLGSGAMFQIARVAQDGTVTEFDFEYNGNGAMVVGLVPMPRIAIMHGDFGGTQTWLIDLAAVEAQSGTLSKRIYPTGTAGSNTGSMTWCPELGKFANHRPTSPATVDWLTPSDPSDPWDSTWSWSSETFTAAGGATTHSVGQGGWNRFVWVPGIKCFLWASENIHEMQAYRPAGT